MSKRSIEIDERLYRRALAKATQENKTLAAVVEANLRDWVGPEPVQPVVTPTPKAQPATTTRTREEIYTVKYGDSLAQIAGKKYGDATKYVLIAQYNGITNPSMIRVGQQLRIPFTETVPVDTQVATTTTQPVTQPSTGGRRFRFPLNKKETNYYRFGSLYAGNSRWAGKPHPGVDFHEYKGANIYAIGEGKVLVNKQDPTGYGHYIMIEHTLTTGEKVYSLYGHMMYDDESFQSPLVGTLLKGDNIIIGKEGDSGYAGVPHVHFEIKKSPQLGLYAMITTYNLTQYFHDPYTFIDNPNNLFVPV
jgi:murein DD-endopeptidase MepM/ murein hydrolase activator NlpD